MQSVAFGLFIACFNGLYCLYTEILQISSNIFYTYAAFKGRKGREEWMGGKGNEGKGREWKERRKGKGEVRMSL